MIMAVEACTRTEKEKKKGSLILSEPTVLQALVISARRITRNEKTGTPSHRYYGTHFPENDEGGAGRAATGTGGGGEQEEGDNRSR